jgi:hypothetical protein
VNMNFDHIKSGSITFEEIMDDITEIQRSSSKSFGEDGKTREKELELNNVEDDGKTKLKCQVKGCNGYHKKVDCPKLRSVSFLFKHIFNGHLFIFREIACCDQYRRHFVVPFLTVTAVSTRPAISPLNGKR